MKILFLGTGLMGAPMAERLLDAGHDLWIYNRTKSKTNKLIEKGAHKVSDLVTAIEKCDIIISMLTDYPAFLEVINDECFASMSGKIVIQMSTISPEESQELKNRIESEGAEYSEAPVLGSIPQIKDGTLTVFVGGTEKQFKEYKKLFKCFGDKIHFLGEVGKATAAKLAFNQLIASLTISFSMSLGYVLSQKIDIEKFMEILRASHLYAPAFDKKLDKMLSRDFTNPNFPVKHLLKDIHLIVREFGANSINISPLIGVEDVLVNSVMEGNGDLDYSALFNTIYPIDKF